MADNDFSSGAMPGEAASLCVRSDTERRFLSAYHEFFPEHLDEALAMPREPAA
jgi:hypothetical protein